MKKLILFLTLILSVVCSSCSKDKEDDPKPSLTNTQWESIKEGISASIDFFNATECKWILKTTTGAVYSTELYTYSYEHPTVTMTPLKDGLAVLKGTISGSAMRLYNVSQDKEIGIYTKK